MSDIARRFRENVTGIVSVLVTGIWLAALLLGFEWWLPFMLFGYIALIPIVSMLFDEDEDEDEEATERQERREETTAGRQQGTDATGASSQDALETLRERYARGELTHQQFERKLEHLLETETLEDAQDRRRGGRPTAERDSDREFDLETETETE